MKLSTFFWPWESEVVIHYPWYLPIFFLILSIVLSMFSWKRMEKAERK